MSPLMLFNFLPWPLVLVVFAVTIAMCVHVVKSGRDIYWLIVLILLPGLGLLIYLLMIYIPEVRGGTRARMFRQAAREALDPEREYREAAHKLKETPTAGARMRLATAAMSLERYAEAERLYAEALTGIHAEDPALLLGRAQALLELNRPQEAMGVIGVLEAQGDVGRSPPAVLALARAQDALGQPERARALYEWAAGRLPGLEGQARYCAFLARHGEMAKARELFAQIDKQYQAAPKPFKKEARKWRALAAEAGPT